MPTTDSNVLLCNRALTRLGVDQITALSDETRQARLLNSAFAFLRDDVNAAAPWGFSMKQVELTQDATAPTFGASYRYALPSDYLGFLRTQAELQGLEEPYRVFGDYIITNSGTVKIEYCAQITDLNQWTSLAKEALIERIMAEVGPSLIGNLGAVKSFWEIYNQKLQMAIAYDASEGTPREFFVDDHLNARHGGTSFGGAKVSDF